MRFCLLSMTLIGCVQEEVVPPTPYADAVYSFSPAKDVTYGQDLMPQVVLGAPEGGGETGSLDVVSLGDGGEIVLEFTDIELTDGPGADLLVFENPFPGWYETGIVSASEDAETWFEWPCDPLDADNEYPGCAGVGLVWASSTNNVDPTDPDTAGGDAFDLAALGLEKAAFIKIVDSGVNTYDSDSGGFDLDAIAVVNGISR